MMVGMTATATVDIGDDDVLEHSSSELCFALQLALGCFGGTITMPPTVGFSGHLSPGVSSFAYLDARCFGMQRSSMKSLLLINAASVCASLVCPNHFSKNVCTKQ